MLDGPSGDPIDGNDDIGNYSTEGFCLWDNMLLTCHIRVELKIILGFLSVQLYLILFYSLAISKTGFWLLGVFPQPLMDK